VHERRYRAQLSGAVWRAGGWLVFTAGFAGALALVARGAARGHASLGDVVLSVTVATSLRDAVQRAVGGSTDTATAGRLVRPNLWLRSYVAERRTVARGTRPAPGTLRDGIELALLVWVGRALARAGPAPSEGTGSAARPPPSPVFAA
jgi:ATP-binding cassette subfamily B protein